VGTCSAAVASRCRAPKRNRSQVHTHT
jgi:hypothetical protein